MDSIFIAPLSWSYLLSIVLTHYTEIPLENQPRRASRERLLSGLVSATLEKIGGFAPFPPHKLLKKLDQNFLMLPPLSKVSKKDMKSPFFVMAVYAGRNSLPTGLVFGLCR
jgi:hypothetical protein